MRGGRLWWSCPLIAVALFVAPVVAGNGFDSAVATASGMPRLRSLLVSWRGDLILERYFHQTRRNRPANIKSASKSVISALVGIAIDRGLIAGVDEKIETFFPKQLARNVDAQKRGITVEDLLTMRSGLESTSGRNYGTWTAQRNWVSYALRRPMVAKPGSRMIYSTGNSHLLSAIITRVSGKSTWAFAQEVLARPLGISLPRWPRDPQGIYFGGNDMEMTPRQMLAFGELYLNRGRAKGRQILPAEWVDRSFIPRTQSRWSHRLYGYGWWMQTMAGHRAYFAWGFGGQFIFVIPDLELVVVTTSSAYNSDGRRGHQHLVYDLVERHVVAPIRAEVSPIHVNGPFISE